MANINFAKVILGGRLTAKPELKTTQSGMELTTFTIAVNRKNGTNNVTDYFNVTAWGKLATRVTQFFDKGSCIVVDGSLQNRTFEDKNGNKRTVTEVKSNEVYFVDSKAEKQSYAQPTQGETSYDSAMIPGLGSTPAKPKEPEPRFEDLIEDDESSLPF